jgi:hypothetical protein
MKTRMLILAVGAIAVFAVPSALAAVPDASSVLRYVSPKAGKYELEVDNTSGIGYITSFAWSSPGKLQLTRITRVQGGSCRMASNTITCTGAKQGIAPPTCSCRPGGAMVVDFTATGYAPDCTPQYCTYHGIPTDLVITGMTPTANPIPSYNAGQPDEPLCDPGTQPSAENQCYVE